MISFARLLKYFYRPLKYNETVLTLRDNLACFVILDIESETKVDDGFGAGENREYIFLLHLIVDLFLLFLCQIPFSLLMEESSDWCWQGLREREYFPGVVCQGFRVYSFIPGLHR